jgi:hypothetical protein
LPVLPARGNIVGVALRNRGADMGTRPRSDPENSTLVEIQGGGDSAKKAFTGEQGGALQTEE